jgi:hypothetical protein
MAEGCLVFHRGFGDPGDWLGGHDEDVGGRLRGNIPESATEFIAMDDFRRNLPVIDFLEKCLHGALKMAVDLRNRKPGSRVWGFIRLAKWSGTDLGNGVPKTENRSRVSVSWKKTLVRGLLVCAGSVTILLPAWLPNRPGAPLERGTVELLQAALLAASTAVMIGALAHSGPRRPVCRVLAFGLAAALVGELEDFISGIMDWRFPDAWVIGILLFAGLFTALRHRWVMLRFFETLGRHAGAGFIAAALLIIYVFNRVVGAPQFWQASLGDSFSPEIPRICKSYLELLACYFIFVGSLGLAITLGRREEPI